MPRQKDSFANLKNSTFNIQHSTLKIKKNASSKVFIKGTTSAADFRKEAQRTSRGRCVTPKAYEQLEISYQNNLFGGMI